MKYEEASAKPSVFSDLKMVLVHYMQRHLNEAIIFKLSQSMLTLCVMWNVHIQ